MDPRRLPYLTSPAGWAWVVLFAGAFVVALAFSALTLPAAQVLPGVPLLGGLLLLLAAALPRRTTVDAVDGTLARRSWRGARRVVRLADARRVEVTRTGHVARLEVDDGVARRRLLPTGVALVASGGYVERSQSPEDLTWLADVIGRHAPGARGSRDTVRALREQAAHLMSGGAVPDSPLGARPSRPAPEEGGWFRRLVRGIGEIP